MIDEICPNKKSIFWSLIPVIRLRDLIGHFDIINILYLFYSGDGIRTHTVEILSFVPAASWATPPIRL